MAYGECGIAHTDRVEYALILYARRAHNQRRQNTLSYSTAKTRCIDNNNKYTTCKKFRRAARAKSNIVILRAERAEKMAIFLTFAPPIRNMDRRP